MNVSNQWSENQLPSREKITNCGMVLSSLHHSVLSSPTFPQTQAGAAFTACCHRKFCTLISQKEQLPGARLWKLWQEIEAQNRNHCNRRLSRNIIRVWWHLFKPKSQWSVNYSQKATTENALPQVYTNFPYNPE